MPMQNIMISKMLHGMRGDNSFQIIKNMATIIGRDTNLSAMATHQKLDDLLKNSVIGIGEGVAVFDWVSDKLETPYIICAVLDTPTLFPAVDENMIDIVLVLVSPEKNGPLHLQYLSRLTRAFRDEKLLTSLKSVTSVDGMMAVLYPNNQQTIAA
jgi:PTS system nitrogen regulatory IIA component